MQEPDIVLISTLCTLAVGGGIFILKIWIEHKIKSEVQHKYDEKLESHKAQLNRDNELAIAAFRQKLEMAASERNLRLSVVFQNTADAIARTYAELLDLQFEARRFTATSDENPQKKSERNSALQDKARMFVDSWRRHRIFVPPKTARHVEQFFATVNRLVSQDVRRSAFKKEFSENSSVVQNMDVNIDKLSDEIELLLSSLVDEFQTELGFTVEKQSEATQRREKE